MIFIWPELDGELKHLEKPFGSKLCGIKRNGRRPAYVMVDQLEIDSYHSWEWYRGLIQNALRPHG